MDHGHGRRRSISVTKIMPLSSVTMSMAEFDFLVSFLQGLYLAKMSIFPILVDHGWIISITVKRPVTRYIISSEYITLLGLGPCGFPSFWISTSNAKFCSV